MDLFFEDEEVNADGSLNRNVIKNIKKDIGEQHLLTFKELNKFENFRTIDIKPNELNTKEKELIERVRNRERNKKYIFK